MDDVKESGITGTPASDVASGDVAEQDAFDLESGVSEISESLGFGQDKGEDKDTDGHTAETEVPSDQIETEANAAAKLDMPKSWAKETQEIWDEMTPRAQEQYLKREKQMLDGLEQYKGDSGFGKQMREIFTPYKAMLQSQGVDEGKAAQYLLNAHYRLSTAQPADRQQYFQHLAKSYGVDLAAFKAAEEAVIDPNVKALHDKVSSLESNLRAREQVTLNEAKTKITAEVEAFAKDPEHQYFDECSEDIVALINAGHTLEAAYEKAVYANPVTRAKELARLQVETEKSLREKSKTEAEAARRASGTNVRSRDTRMAPTEPKGTMEDTMRSTLNEIKQRTH